jgi:hypothetical protein
VVVEVVVVAVVVVFSDPSLLSAGGAGITTAAQPLPQVVLSWFATVVKFV